MTQHPFEGMVIIPAQQLADIVAAMTAKAVREELDRREATAQHIEQLPNDVPAAKAAQHCGYRSAKSLVQFHGHGLTPVYLGKRLFYKKKEVEALRKKRQNL